MLNETVAPFLMSLFSVHLVAAGPAAAVAAVASALARVAASVLVAVGLSPSPAAAEPFAARTLAE